MRAFSNIPAGRFFGADIEPGTFHGADIEPGTFHHWYPPDTIVGQRPERPADGDTPVEREPQSSTAEKADDAADQRGKEAVDRRD